MLVIKRMYLLSKQATPTWAEHLFLWSRATLYAAIYRAQPHSAFYVVQDGGVYFYKEIRS